MAVVNTYALVNLDNARDFLQLKGDQETRENVLIDIINHVSNRIESYCDRHFISRGELTEYYDGNGTNKLFTRYYPITAVSNIYSDTDWAWGSDTEITSDYYRIGQNSRYILLKNDNFEEDYQNIKVIYTAGYTDRSSLPDDLRHACLLHVYRIYQKYWKNADVAVSDVSDDSGGRSYLSEQFDPEVKGILDTYRRVHAC
jgi:hypothetical protein